MGRISTTVLLVLPTGTYRAEEYLAAAEHLGLDVVIGSDQPQAMAEVMGDRFLQLPLDEPAAAAGRIVDHLRQATGDGPGAAAVISVDDQGSLAAALAARELHLPHSPPEAVALTRDKGAMRAMFARAAIPQPDFAVAPPVGPAVASAADRIGCPVVVKPRTLSGSRGVIRADSPAEAAAAAQWIAAIQADAGERADSHLMVERFVPGAEVAVEGILSEGVLEIIAVFDKPDPLDGPYFEETLYVSPSRLPHPLLDAVAEATASAVRALGLTEGPVHAELRVPGAGGAVPGAGRVSVLEVAARTIGGRCSKAIVLENGSSLEELVLAAAVRLPRPPARLRQPAGVLMIPIPSSGFLRAVEGIEQARAVPGITGLEITIPPGRPVRALPEGDRYLGFVFAAGESAESVEAALRAADECLAVRIDPVRDGTAGRRRRIPAQS
jgi:biotin carboxylase